MSTHDDLLTTEQAAQMLGLSTKTLAAWRSTGRHGLPYLKVGSAVRYQLSDIRIWLNERKGTATPRSNLSTATGATKTFASIQKYGIQLFGNAYRLHDKLEREVKGDLVGLARLGNNNAENRFGWSGIKCVILADNSLWVVDYPSSSWVSGKELTDWFPDEIYARGTPLGLLDLSSRNPADEEL